MGFFRQLRTTKLLRTNQALGEESDRFTGLLRAAFVSPRVTAILSNYVHDEDQDFNRKDLLDASSFAFDTAWMTAQDAYEDTADGDAEAHTRFLALVSDLAPYEGYAYKDELRARYFKELVDRMILLVKRG